MKTVQCDICKRTQEDIYNAGAISGIYHFKASFWDSPTIRKFDICTRCLTEIERQMKKEVK